MSTQNKHTDLEEQPSKKNEVMLDLNDAKKWLDKNANQDLWTAVRKKGNVTIGQNPWYIYEVCFADRSTQKIYKVIETNKHYPNMTDYTYWGNESPY